MNKFSYFPLIYLLLARYQFAVTKLDYFKGLSKDSV